MLLNKFIQNLIRNLLNLIIFPLFYQPIQNISFNPQISSINVGDTIFIINQGRKLIYSKTPGLILVSSLQRIIRFDLSLFVVNLDKDYPILITFIINVLHCFQDLTRHSVSLFVYNIEYLMNYYAISITSYRREQQQYCDLHKHLCCQPLPWLFYQQLQH